MTDKSAAATHRAIEKRIKAASSTSLPIASPPVFRAAEGRPAAAQLQRVFATIEARAVDEQQKQHQLQHQQNPTTTATTDHSQRMATHTAQQKAKLDALLQAFNEEKEAGRSDADKTLTAFRIERTLAKDETDEADRLVHIALNAIARAMNEALAATEAAAVNALTVGKESILRSGLSSCSRGLILPYEFFGRAVQMAQTAVEHTFEHWVSRGHARVSLAADEAAARGVAHTTESLADLEKSMERDVFTKSQMELFDGVRDDCLVALRAAIVWRMLHQVQGSVAGMKEATAAFEELLPCIFGGIEVHALPHMPSLGGQALQLLRFPTLRTEIASLRASAEHLRLDADYFRKAMQHWAVTIWFRQLVGERRKTGVLDRVGSTFDRLSRRNTKRKAFAAWKMLATRGRIARFVLRTSHELQDAMNASRVADGLDGKDGAAAAAAARRSKDNAVDDLSCLQSSEPWTLLGETALDAVKTLTVVCSAFRTQIARQRETIDRVESERDHLRDKVSLLESKLMRQIEVTNAKANDVERLQQQLHESRCGHNNAKSRLLQQEHVPWRDQALELIKQVAVVPPLRPSLAPPLPVFNHGHNQNQQQQHDTQSVTSGNTNTNATTTTTQQQHPRPPSSSSRGGGDATTPIPGLRTPGRRFQSYRTNYDDNNSNVDDKASSVGGITTATSTMTGRLNNHTMRSSGRSLTSRRSTAYQRNRSGRSRSPMSASQRSGTPAGGGGGGGLTTDALHDHQQHERDLMNPFTVHVDEPERIVSRWINQCLDDLQALENHNQSAIALLL